MLTEPSIPLSIIKDLDVEDLARLPRGYRYELREGNLFITTPSTYWHKRMARRLLLMLFAAGLDVLQDTGVRGDRPRDNRVPDLGVIGDDSAETAGISNLPGSAFRLVVEIVSENSPNGEYTDKASWYAHRGIPEYWIVDQDPEGSQGDAVVLMHRLAGEAEDPVYDHVRTVRLSELEAEYREKRAG
ncbi:Uma2 family endonuclease [Actinoplanes siamensis]|uniref:Uma2 family endonuclease n=1 Tax=Actinoplanes siamensis TaxID=1223317 RepID=UPI001EF29F76|nr:Uma2 family endonuclease [Actinoplanes siamensis]